MRVDDDTLPSMYTTPGNSYDRIRGHLLAGVYTKLHEADVAGGPDRSSSPPAGYQRNGFDEDAKARVRAFNTAAATATVLHELDAVKYPAAHTSVI